MGRIFIWLMVAFNLSACFQGESDSLRNGVSSSGVSMEVWGNLPYGSSEAQVAASVYLDGSKKALVGGDVVKAYSESDETILRSIENLSGDYVSSLTVLNPMAGLEFEVDFDPEGAREDRWYPVDELLVDPGPGELVGYTSQLNFPAPILLNTPAQNTVYTSRSQDISLSWDVNISTEQMRMTAVRECHSGDRSVRWATSTIIDNSGDPGSYSRTISSLIPDTGLLTVALDALAQLSVIVVSAILESYTFGLIHPESISFDSFVIDYCDIDITLFREISGTLGPGVSGGNAIASTSETVHVIFDPN